MGIMMKTRPRRSIKNAEHHDDGGHDRRDGPGNWSRTLDELSREEILQALAGLDEPV